MITAVRFIGGMEERKTPVEIYPKWGGENIAFRPPPQKIPLTGQLGGVIRLAFVTLETRI
jgi:hypothetical protein